MEEKLFSELVKYFNVVDLVAIFAVYFIVQQLKPAVSKVLRPYLVFIVGFSVAIAIGASFGGVKMVLFFGIFYSAGAIAVRKTKVIDRLTNAANKKFGDIDG